MLRFFLRTGIFAFLLSCPLFLLLSQQLAFKQYNRATGLPSDYILCILQDRHGFLWFGTDRGTGRYDGRSFKTFTAADGLGSNFVRRIFEDRDGNIWFGLIEGGVTRFDGSSLKTYTTADGLFAESWTQGDLPKGIDTLLSRGYFTTDNMLIMNDTWNCYLPGEPPCVTSSIEEDNRICFEWIKMFGLKCWSIWDFADGGPGERNPNGDVNNDGTGLTRKGEIHRAEALVWKEIISPPPLVQ